MKSVLSIVIVIAFAIIACSAIDCKKDVCRKQGLRNTVCKYKDPNPAAACGKVLSVGFTNSEKREIVDEHNRLRSFVANGLETRGNPGPQPPASNMQKMSWDDELAMIAQRWANQCKPDTDKCMDVDRFYVGQNVASLTTTNTAINQSQIVEMWYNDVREMDRNQVPRLTNENIASAYTQVVWANSNKLGCGKIVNDTEYYPLRTFTVVCNYGPGGNIMNQPVYQIRN